MLSHTPSIFNDELNTVDILTSVDKRQMLTLKHGNC